MSVVLVDVLLTVTVSVVVVAHCTAVGVKVYVAVAVLLTVAGLQVPVIPLFDVVGRTGAADPLQIAAGWVNVGVIELLVARFSVATESHPLLLINITVYVPAVLYVC